MAAIAALTSGSGPVSLVTTIDASGARSDNALRAASCTCLPASSWRSRWCSSGRPSLLFSKQLHPGQWVAVGFMAAASTAAVVVALSGGSVSLGGTDWPYIVAFPLIVVAAVLELVRMRRLRARWGE